MQLAPGLDGFLATADTPDYAHQVRLAEYLHGHTSLRRLRKELTKPELVGQVRAIHARIAWIADHAAELSEPRRWQKVLADLARELYGLGLPFEEADLVALLDSHRKHEALWSFGPEQLVVAHLDTHDLSAALVAALRRFHAELTGIPGGSKYQSQTSYQLAVAHIHKLLWHDLSDALDPSRCWSDHVRRDLRAMTGARRAHWNALFRHIKGNSPAKPSASWLKEAETRLAQVGLDDFRERLCTWLAPLGGGEPQSLKVAGSHILRGLLWYAALSRDMAVATASLMLLDTRWKAKRNVDKAMVALVAVLEMLPPPVAWPSLLRLQQEWPTGSIQVERLLKKTAAEFGITEEELKARALLKPQLDVDELKERWLERWHKMPMQVRVLDAYGQATYVTVRRPSAASDD
jgi:hypothetical protein